MILALIAPTAAAVLVSDPGHLSVLLAIVVLAGSLLVGPVIAWGARAWVTGNDVDQVVDLGTTSPHPGEHGWHSAAVMAACGVTFGVIALRWATTWSAVPVAVLAAGALLIGTVDVAVQRIPTIFVRLTTAAVCPVVVVSAATGHRPGALLGALVGALGLWSVLGVVRIVTRGGLGGGDVRLGALLGLVVGWGAWTASEPLRPLSAVCSALVLAGVMSASAHAIGRGTRGLRTALPFAPSLAGGALTVLVLS